MLHEISITNIALIEKLRIELNDGMTVLTGETGAGKSIIIDSIGFVLGGRAQRDIIRSGENQACVEALFYVNNTITLFVIRDMGIDIDDDNAILLYRSLTTDGKTVCRINGRTVSLGMLKDVSSLLVDICGQNEHQSLMSASKHLDLIDNYAGTGKLNALKQALAEKCALYDETVVMMNSISGDESERASKIELYSYQKNELESAKIKPGEEDLLLERKKGLNNFEKLFSSATRAIELLDNENDGLSTLDRLSKSISHTDAVSAIDETRRHISEKLSEAHDLACEALYELKNYISGLDNDPDEIDKLETRLDILYNLKRKYSAMNADELLEKLGSITKKLDFIINSGEEIKRLDEKRLMLESEILDLCMDLSDIRKKASNEIKETVVATLGELGMKNVNFEVDFTKKSGFDANGFDKTEFLISPNPGEPLKPLIKTASGGEMSRIMLALKNVFISPDSVNTLIFDEIDAGVSGRAAQSVAEKLVRLSKTHQVICVSHLPQIASMADNHYIIEKETDGDRTNTHVNLLDDSGSIRELARLMSGAQITEASLAASEEMKKLAGSYKNNLY